MRSPLRRVGNKQKLLPKLLEIFPDRPWAFIDLFMGTGNVALAMVARARYVFANDKENDIFNLFQVLKARREELISALEAIPFHESLFQHWRAEQEHDPIWRAVRFLYLSNFGYVGKSETCHFCDANHLSILHTTTRGLVIPENLQFLCCDFREVIQKIAFHDQENTIATTLLYADPPYLDMGHNYQNGFTEADLRDLFGILEAWQGPWALSGFSHPVIMEWQEFHGWYVHLLAERRTMKSRNTELVITNYQPSGQQDLFRT